MIARALISLASADEPYSLALQEWLREAGAPEEEIAGIASSMVAAEASVAWETGSVELRDGAIAVELAEGERYASPADASRVLEMWGNPPDPDTDGMLLPAGAHLFGPDSWAVLVRFQDDGWVDDSDAASIDYDDLLGDMQASQEQGNEERTSLGLDGVHLTGWAEPPHYDAASNVLYWATLLRADDGGVTLNYDVRVLGRRGVLSLNALASADDLERVKAGMESVRSRATFNEGHRYADFDPSADAKATYGIAALVAGGAIAAKTGLFKGLLALLLASKKLLLVAGVAVLGAARSLWSRVTGRSAEDE